MLFKRLRRQRRSAPSLRASRRQVFLNRLAQVEQLEDRRMLAVGAFVVNTSLDLPDAIVGDGLAQAANGETSLRAAVMEANANSDLDTITFDPALLNSADLVISLLTADSASSGDSALVIDSPITISGPAGDFGVTIARPNSSDFFRLFDVLPGGNLTLQRLNLTGGDSQAGQGGAIRNHGQLQLDSVTLSDHSSGRGVDWTQFGGNAGHNRYVDVAVSPNALTETWNVPLDYDQSGTGSWYERGVAIDRNHVYRTSLEGYAPRGDYHVQAFDTQTGALAWTQTIVGNAFEGVSEPTLANGLVYVNRAGHSGISGGTDADLPRLYALDPQTGARLDNVSYQAQWGSNERPVILDGQLVVQNGYYGGVSSYSASTLDEQYFKTHTEQLERPAAALDDEYVYVFGERVLRRSDGADLPDISHPSGYAITSPVVSPSSHLLFDVRDASDRGIASYDGDTHQLRWTALTPGVPLVKAAGNGVVAVSAGDTVYLYNESTGALVHSWQAPANLVNEMVLTRTHVFVESYFSSITKIARVHAINLATGLEDWTYTHQVSVQEPTAVMELAMGAGQLVMSHQLFVRAFSAADIVNVTGQGGAIYNNGGEVSLVNTTLSNNRSIGGVGGAVYNYNGDLTIESSTISNNFAAAGRGVYHLGDDGVATATIARSILGQADNSVTDFEAAVAGSGVATSTGGDNLIRSHFAFGGQVISDADPGLMPLADNGGPVWTHSPNIGSLAIDGTSTSQAVATDARGVARPEGASDDVGAVEKINSPPNVTGETYLIDEDQGFVFTLSELISNDFDPDLDPISILSFPQVAPGHGQLLDLGGGQHRYQPNPHYFGLDSFTYRVSDGRGGTADGTVSIAINSVNDVPESTSFVVNMVQNSTKMFDLQSTDADGDTITYAVVTGPTLGQWGLSSSTVTYTPPADYTGVQTLQYRANDGAADGPIATVTINVLENVPPTVEVTGAPAALSEDTDTTNRIKVGDIVVTDDTSGFNDLSLLGLDSSKFEIVGTELFLRAGATLDYEAQQTLQVTIAVDDLSVGNFPDDTFDLVINLLNVNDVLPTVAFALGGSVTIAENSNAGGDVKVGDVTIADDGGPVNLTLGGPDAASFLLIGSELFLRQGVTTDFETDPLLEVSVIADDPTLGGNPDSIAELDVMLSNVNDVAPTLSLTNVTVSIHEAADTSSRIKVANIIVLDDGLGTNNLSLIGADAALFEVIGFELFLKAGASLDFETNPVLNLTVQVDDATLGSTPDDSVDVTINVTNVNDDPPTVALSNTNTLILEDASTASAIRVADITITDDGIGSNQIALSGPDAALFEVISGELRLRALTSLDFETQMTLEVVVEVDDPTLGATPDDTEALTIQIGNVNDVAPSITLAAAISSIAEDASTASRIKVADVLIVDDGLGVNQLTLAGSDADKFELDGTEVFLKANTSLNFESQTQLNAIVHVDDATLGGAPDDSAAFTLDITDVNDVLPTLSFANTTTAVLENSSNVTRIKVADLVVTDVDGGATSFSLSGADQAKFELDGSQLFIKPGTTLDHEAQASFTVDVSVDDPTLGVSPDDTKQLVVQITNVNDLPPIFGLANVVSVVQENTDTTSPLKIADLVVDHQDGGSHQYTLNGPDAARFFISNDQLFLKAGVQLDYEQQTNYRVDVSMDDPAVGDSPDATRVLNLTVENVNDVAPIVQLTNVETAVSEGLNTQIRKKIADIVVTDDGFGANQLSLSGPDAALFDIDGSELILTNGAVLDFESNPVLNVTVTVFDVDLNGGSEDSATIAVTNINDVTPTVALTGVVDVLPEDLDTSQLVKVADVFVLDDGLGLNQLTLTGTHATFFQVIGVELFLRAGASLDYETTPVLTFTINVDDFTLGGPVDFSLPVTIPVGDANDTPPQISLDNAVTSLPEDTDTANRIKVADVVLNDSDGGEVNLTLSGADAGMFEVEALELFLKANTALDFETQSVLNVTVQADDPTLGGNPDDSTDLTINVTNVNEAGWHNPTMTTDVNGDSFVNISDLRVTFVYFVDTGGGTLDPLGPPGPGIMVDVNNDGLFSITDLRLVFVSVSVGEGEGESAFASSVAPPRDFDEEEERTRLLWSTDDNWWDEL